MDYKLDCKCGNALKVFASNCGESATCPRCDRIMVVPHLSELRRRAGVISDDIATKLRLMNLEKLLPIEDHCVECGTPTDKQLYCQIECERVYAKKIGFINYVGYIVSVLFLLISFWFWLILYMFHKQHESRCTFSGPDCDYHPTNKFSYLSMSAVGRKICW